MSESKKTGSNKSREETRAEAADALHRAAELIASLNQTLDETAEAPTKPAAKKPAAKKSTAAKKPAAKKPAAKKTTAAKKPAAKPAPKKEEPVEEAPVEEPVATVESEPAVVFDEQPVELVQPEPQPEPEPAPAPEPVEEKPSEVKAEEPQKVEEQAPAAAAATTTVTTTETKTVRKSFKQKSNDFVSNKGKLPIFIVANVLLLLSSILLIATAFNVTSYITGKTETFSLFGYYSNSAYIKDLLSHLALEWANGGYVLIGMLMFFAFLVPLALIGKNVFLFIKKKDKNVHALDAIVTLAFLLAYLGVVNLYGANMTAGQIIAFIVALVLLAFTIFVMLIQRNKARLPIFSIVNIVLAIMCVFLLTATPIYDPSIYAAGAASLSGGAGFAFILLLATVAALVLLVLLQLIKKLPALMEIIVPIAAGVLALIALISMAGGKPDGFSMGGAFVFGVVLTMLLAIANVIFAFVPQLKKFKVQVKDDEPLVFVTETVTTVTTVTQNGETTTVTETEQTEQTVGQPEQPAAEENAAAPAQSVIVCAKCNTENEAGSVFCCKCGDKLK